MHSRFVRPYLRMLQFRVQEGHASISCLRTGLLSVQAPVLPTRASNYVPAGREQRGKGKLAAAAKVPRWRAQADKGILCRHLYFPPDQHPIVCQLGGSNPEKLAAAAKIVASYGYDEINLNCGCPSDRVAGAGCFGASLMLQPEAVGDACRAMREATGTEVTVKCRLGISSSPSVVQSDQEILTGRRWLLVSLMLQMEA